MNLATLLLPLIVLLQPGAAQSLPQLELSLKAAHETIQPGGESELALELRIPEGWYIYHPLILDAGSPTTITFDLPDGVSIGELRFPAPSIGEEQKQAYLALEEEAILVTKVRLAEGVGLEPLELTATVHAQARAERTIELEAQASLTLAVSEQEPVPANQELFEDAHYYLPQTLGQADYVQGSRLLVSHTQVPVGGKALIAAIIRVKPRHHIQDRDPGVENLIPSRLFIESRAGLEFGQQIWPKPHISQSASLGKVREQLGEFIIQVPFEITAADFQPGPVRLRVLFHYQCCSDAGTCFPPNMAAGFVEFEVVPAGTPAVKNNDPAIEKLATQTHDAATSAEIPSPNLLLVFLGAFVGGVILNIMPCVLPVITLKIFGFVQQAGDDRGRIFRMGLTYTAGIMASFAVLAVAMVTAGLAWGGLMQQPGFLIGLSAVVFAFALSLLGVFELQLPGMALNVAGEASSKEGYGGAFLNGILTTLLATPCVGPFLGSAIGVLTQMPPLLAGAGIMVVGLGLATPYVLLTAFPGWLRFLPKPGPWMVSFKQIVGFVLLAVVVWLVSILITMVEDGAIVGLLGMLCMVGVGCWLLGKINLRAGPGRAARLWIAALVLMVGGGWTSFWIFGEGDNKIPWQKWEPGIAPRLAAEGYTVYVDYTADWCLTCQWNKAMVLETTRIADELEQLGVYPIKAEFTQGSKPMQQELQKHGRNGVPLNIVIPAGKPDDAIILPEVLTKQIVLDALKKAGRSAQRPDFWPPEP